ncbi:MAG: hypothetical protein IJ887_04435 [Prevotella sp.]|nr:hypothetical protein [Prevotella sp.]MBR3479162.1 hypothetical protein [Prevotella sp.]
MKNDQDMEVYDNPKASNNMLMSHYARGSRFDDKTGIEKPFWHLESDGFWHLNYQGERLSKSHTPSKAWLKESVEFAHFDEPLWILLQNRAWRKENLASLVVIVFFQP